MQNETTTKTKVIIKKCRRDQKKFSDFVYTVEEFWGSSHLLATVSWQSCSGLLQTAWQAQKGEGRGGGGGGKREGSAVPHPQSPITLPFPLPPNPLPLSTPATQATLVYPNQRQNAVFTPMASEYRTLALCMFIKRKRRCLSLKHTF